MNSGVVSRCLLAVLLTTLQFGCAREAAVQIRDARAVATPPGARAGAVYLDLIAAEDDELLAVTTPVAERAEMHSTTITDDGMMQMRPVATVALSAGQVVRFAAGGMHLMLMNLHAPLPAGSTFSLELRFRKAGTLPTQVTVVAPGSIDVSH